MDELFVLLKIANLIELLLDEILYSLHIVIGGLLNLFHTSGILLREILIDGSQSIEIM